VAALRPPPARAIDEGQGAVGKRLGARGEVDERREFVDSLGKARGRALRRSMQGKPAEQPRSGQACDRLAHGG
jgi:hypothetical protein